MTCSRRASRTITVLMATTALIGAGSAAAQDRGDLEDRVSRLEGLLERILERLEDHGSKLEGQEVELLEQAQRIVDQQQQMVEQKQQVAQVSETVREVATNVDPERATGFSIGDTQVSFGGFVKLDTIATRFSDGDLPSGSLGRDFYFPGLIPVGGGGVDDGGDDGFDLDFNPRETRFIFTTTTPVGGHRLGSHLEFDFQVTSGANERVSNSFTPRMRRAFLTFDNWLFGQDWSTFQDVGALPENLDFIGPAESTTFVRQAVIRYTRGPLELAIEQPEGTFTPFGGGRIAPGDERLPDFVARYSLKRDWGTVRLAGIVRELRVEEGTLPTVTDDDSAIGYGASLSGKINVGARDDVRFMVNVGEGLGRYVGLNLVNGAAIDENGELDAILLYSAFASYRHFWTPKWRSNLTLGGFKADNPTELTGLGVTDSAWSVHANILYSPVSKFTVGLEYIYAAREIEAGDSGTMNRIQFSAKYGF